MKRAVLFVVFLVLSGCATPDTGCWSGLNNVYCQDLENLDEERRWNIPPAPPSGLNATCVKSGGAASMTAMSLTASAPESKS